MCCAGCVELGSDCAKTVPKTPKAPSVRIGAFGFSYYFQLVIWLRGHETTETYPQAETFLENELDQRTDKR